VRPIPPRSATPDSEAVPPDGGLRLDPTGGEPKPETDGGVAGWAIALALVGLVGALFLLRRRLLPPKLRRRPPRLE
jgi:hypothetical protein